MTIIAGRFQPLDQARPGVPQRARDLQTAQTVLLRTAVMPAGSSDAAFARAESARGIFHPSLITLFEVIRQPEDHLLLAYEFVAAQPVAHVSGGQPLHPRRATEIVIEIADALAELHAHGIVHGGVSSSTVLVTLKGKAKLDRVADPTVAPLEQGPEADLAALGALLSELAARPSGAGMPGMPAIEAIIARARQGRFESAATLAAMLRRI